MCAFSVNNQKFWLRVFLSEGAKKVRTQFEKITYCGICPLCFFDTDRAKIRQKRLRGGPFFNCVLNFHTTLNTPHMVEGEGADSKTLGNPGAFERFQKPCKLIFATAGHRVHPLKFPEESHDFV